MISAKIKRMYRLAGLVLGVAAALLVSDRGSLLAQEEQGKTFNLELDIDQVLALPDLWQMSPDDLEKNTARADFRSNPFFTWAAEPDSGRRFALFGRAPYKNVAVKATAFKGTVPIEKMVIEFVEDKPASVLVIAETPKVEGPVGIDAFETVRKNVSAGLKDWSGAEPVRYKRYYGSKRTASLRTEGFTGSKATACLDAGAEVSLVRFMLKPAGSAVGQILSHPVIELDQQATEYFCDLDGLLKLPELWNMTTAQFEAAFGMDVVSESPVFQWVSVSKEAARFSRQPFSNISVDLSLFNGHAHVDEAIFDFKDGKVSQVYVSLYNRGDSGSIDREAFDARFKLAGQSLINLLGTRPLERKASTQTAVKTTGWLWTSPHTLALLEHNRDALIKKAAAEFLRLRLTPASSKDQLLNIAAIGQTTTTLSRSDLPKFVKKEDNGDVYIDGIPMVDQGAKGYCVVASCQRVFGYLNIPCDQHELASVAGSEADSGTSGAAFVEALSKIDNRFKVRFKPLLEKMPMRSSGAREERPDRFAKMIQENIDRGVPLLWALQLGLVPEEPDTALQVGGGHMRLIIGYNIPREEIIFSDSWGAGHEKKRMKLTDAIKASYGVYSVEPKLR